MDRQEKGYGLYFARLTYLLLAIAGAVLFFRFLYRPVLPFLTAWLIAAVLQTPVRRIVEKTGWKRKPVCIILVVLFSGMLVALLYSLLNSLIFRARALLVFLGENMDKITAFFSDWSQKLKSLLQSLPFLREGGEGSVAAEVLAAMDDFFGDMLGEFTQVLSAKIPAWIGGLAARIPSVLLFLVMTLLAAVYISCDYEKLARFCREHLPRRISGFFARLSRHGTRTVKQYLRAYVLLMAITFFLLLTGFLILGVSYPAGLALLVALVDVLPVLGVGTVLIPWALISFCTGNLFWGIGLTVLYIVVVVLRQILEPRIVGASIGLHPLLTLFSMYVGLKLFGIGGLVLFPIGFTVVKGLIGETAREDEKTHGKTAR